MNQWWFPAPELAECPKRCTMLVQSWPQEHQRTTRVSLTGICSSIGGMTLEWGDDKHRLWWDNYLKDDEWQSILNTNAGSIPPTVVCVGTYGPKLCDTGHSFVTASLTQVTGKLLVSIWSEMMEQEIIELCSIVFSTSDSLWPARLVCECHLNDESLLTNCGTSPSLCNYAIMRWEHRTLWHCFSYDGHGI